MLGAFLVCMRFIEGLFHTLWPGPEPMLFYRVPLSMVINAQESWLLLAFVVLSAISIIRAISVPALRHGAATLRRSGRNRGKTGVSCIAAAGATAGAPLPAAGPGRPR